MISLPAFSELLEVLYAIPLHPQQWSHLLDLLCLHTGSRNAFLICANNHHTLAVQAMGGAPLDMSMIENYDAHYAPTDPLRLPFLRSGRTGVIDCAELLPLEELWKSEMFRNLNGPMGYKYPALVALTCSLRRLEVISFWRTPDEGTMPVEAMQLLELLVPHLQSALEIRQVLGVAQQRLASAEVMADASPTATFLITPRGEIQHCNQAARTLLEQADGLIQHNGILRAADANARDALRDFLHRVPPASLTQAASLPGTRALSLPRTSGRSPLQLLSSPVPQRGPAASETLLLLVTDPEKPIYLRDDLMRDHFEFTAAETEIANGLLTGYSLEEIATLRRVSSGTVRHQLKSIFRKTATGRQADLIRVLVNLPSPPPNQSSAPSRRCLTLN